MSASPAGHDRLLELLAEARLGSLSSEEMAELESLCAAHGVDASLDADVAVGELVLLLDEASGEKDEMPASLAASLSRRGRAMVGAEVVGGVGTESAVAGRLPGGVVAGGGPGGAGLRRGNWLAVAAAASIVAVVSVGFGIMMAQGRSASDAAYEQRLAAMEAQISENAGVLALARERASVMEAQLAQAAAREIGFAQRLADATAALDRAELTIARFEAPRDPAELAQNRRKLLEVPGSVRLAWSPFDLPDAPAEQREVRGDVVWNDGLQTGYLRFIGLAANDPSVEQYQVWVIDERGLEQKVSGGVFNATADGEVIVPIEPGIDVGRVALFAITVENPGGTWVPDLARRVVVAPRDG